MKRATALTGAAGTFYVASRLAFEGFNAAVTLGNAPMVDILVSSAEGDAKVAVQVKTTEWAHRPAGRNAEKNPAHYEWDIGWRTANKSPPDLILALVDLKQMKELPDIYFVPSSVVVEAFRLITSRCGTLKRWRWHPPVESIDKYRNNFGIVRDRLATVSASTSLQPRGE